MTWRCLFLVVGLVIPLPGARADTARLTGVEMEERWGETVVHLRIDGHVRKPGVQTLSDHRLIVDLPHVEAELPSHRIPGETPILARVRIGLHSDPVPRTRVVFDLLGPSEYTVAFEDSGLVVLLRSADAATTKEVVTRPARGGSSAEPIENPTPAP